MEGDFAIAPFALTINISIHSLRMEGDFSKMFTPALILYFNPLPPYGGRLQAWC